MYLNPKENGNGFKTGQVRKEICIVIKKAFSMFQFNMFGSLKKLHILFTYIIRKLVVVIIAEM